MQQSFADEATLSIPISIVDEIVGDDDDGDDEDDEPQGGGDAA